MPKKYVNIYMQLLKQYFDEINTYFDQSAIQGSPSSLYDPIDYLMGLSGKRLRPALVVAACHLFDHPYQEAIPAAYAFELFHNFTLMHDDIMDNSDLRRGHETVHVKYDINSAILSGDVMLIHSYEILSKYEGQVAIDLIRSFSKMAIDLCAGQRMDMDFEVSDVVTIPAYIAMIKNKTGVLIAASMYAGAIIANAPLHKRDHMYDFGKNLGIAFQIQDDILDAFGNEEQVGKKPGGDIIQNKKTYLYLKALELSDETQKASLIHFYQPNATHSEEDKINTVKGIFVKTGALEYANQLREVYYDLAISHLRQLELEASKEEAMIAFAKSFVAREK